MPPALRIVPLIWAFTVCYGVWAVAMAMGAVERGGWNDALSMPSYYIPGLGLWRVSLAERNAILRLVRMSGHGVPPCDTEMAGRLAAPVMQKPPTLDGVARLLVATLNANVAPREGSIA